MLSEKLTGVSDEVIGEIELSYAEWTILHATSVLVVVKAGIVYEPSESFN